MAETTGLLNRRTGHSVPGVRIPLSPHLNILMLFSGYSAVRLAHLVWDQGVAGSNPATPTKFKRVKLLRFSLTLFYGVNCQNKNEATPKE